MILTSNVYNVIILSGKLIEGTQMNRQTTILETSLHNNQIGFLPVVFENNDPLLGKKSSGEESVHLFHVENSGALKNAAPGEMWQVEVIEYHISDRRDRSQANDGKGRPMVIIKVRVCRPVITEVRHYFDGNTDHWISAKFSGDTPIDITSIPAKREWVEVLYESSSPHKIVNLERIVSGSGAVLQLRRHSDPVPVKQYLERHNLSLAQLVKDGTLEQYLPETKIDRIPPLWH